ncbi:MAG: hypothetical protein KF812_09630 [Fimbriimonadaceae bacterium]|nr:hypothetical protein [Fimbriimonadaceae bacterium]
MNPALRTLLGHSIDYAGQFPPASLDLDAALREFSEIRRGPDAWIVDRFIAKLDQAESLGETSQLPLALVAATEEGAVRDGVSKAIDIALNLGATSLEIRIPGSLNAAKEAATTARKRASALDEGQLQVFFEFPWDEELTDWLDEAVSAWEDAGFKARTGGTTAEAFPSPLELAEFIYVALSLESTIKFTAGLHEAIRYGDSTLGVKRHGFLNVLGGTAVARAHDLNRREIIEILECEDTAKFGPMGEDFMIAGHRLTEDDATEFHTIFGGLGSCSIAEPLDSLHRLGWLGGVKA